MKSSTARTRRLRRFLVPTVALAAIIAPAAAAGTDSGIGIPAGRDDPGRPVTLSQVTPALASPAPTSAQFQWGDAGIGASTALGIVALTGGGILVLRRQRSHVRTS
jgi:hypothetical protein